MPLPTVHEEEVVIPPKSIWNPPTLQMTDSYDDSSIDDDPHSKLPFSEREVQIQIWDTFRLARVVLEKPITTRRIQSHMIMKAIRKVAEMKLQIIQLQKQREESMKIESTTTIVERNVENLAAGNTSSPTSRFKERVLQLQRSQDLQALKDEIETFPNYQTIFKDPSSSSGEHPLIKPNLSSSDTCTTASGTTGPSLQHQQQHHHQHYIYSEYEEEIKDDNPVALLRNQILTQSESESKPPAIVSPPVTPTKTKQALMSISIEEASKNIVVPPVSPESPNSTTSSVISQLSYKDEALRLWKQHQQEQQHEIESLLMSLENKVQETSHFTTKQIQELHNEIAVVKEGQSKERGTKKFSKGQKSQNHDEIESLLTGLYAKVQETSDQTSTQIAILQKTLVDAKHEQETIQNEVIGSFKQRLRQQKQKQKTTIKTIVAHYLTVEKQLQDEIDTLQKQMTLQNLHMKELEEKQQRQQQEPQDSNVTNKPFNVSPIEIQQILYQVLDLEKQTQSNSNLLEDLEDVKDDGTNASKVHKEVIKLLLQVLKWQTQQKNRIEDLESSLNLAKQKESESIDEVDFLKLQKAIFVEDTTTITKEQYNDMIEKQREVYQHKIHQMIKDEEQRLQEMNALEIELTHLAFLAIQIEDSELEYKQQQEQQKESLHKLQEQSKQTMEELHLLSNDVQQSIEYHGKKIMKDGKDEEETKPSAAELRIRQLETALAQSNVELLHTKNQLQQSQERVRALERRGLESKEC